MRFLHGFLVFSAIMGLAGTASATSEFTPLVGTWDRSALSCTPISMCNMPRTLLIEQVKSDGQLVAKYFGVHFRIGGWGRASLEGEKLQVLVTLEDGGTLQLRLNKQGNELEGFAETYDDWYEAVVSFKRVTP